MISGTAVSGLPERPVQSFYVPSRPLLEMLGHQQIGRSDIRSPARHPDWAYSRARSGRDVVTIAWPADQYAGMLNAAIRPNEFDQYEPQHLLSIRHQLRRVGGQAWGYGFKVMALPDTMTSYPWWPSEGL